jgi:hypothetical protein
MSDNKKTPGNGPYRAEKAEFKFGSPEQTEIEKLKIEVEGLKLELRSLRRKEKWEYTVFVDNTLIGENYQKMLNKEGKNGWELASTERTGNTIIFFLKRPL